jgi:hypothetical protein
MNVLRTLLDNDISKPIMRSMFQFINVEFANAKHCTNITFLHPQKNTIKSNMSLKHKV